MQNNLRLITPVMLSTPRRSGRRVARNISPPPSSGKKTRAGSMSDLASSYTPVKDRIQDLSKNKIQDLRKDESFFTKSALLSAPPRPPVSPERSSNAENVRKIVDVSSKLPTHYEVLYKQFKAVEEVIGIMKTRNTLPRLSEISSNVSDVTKHRFNLPRMQQLLAVAGKELRVEFRVIDGKREPCALQIDGDSGKEIFSRMSSATIRSRQESVLNNLVRLVDKARKEKVEAGNTFDIELDCPPIVGVRVEANDACPDESEVSTPKKRLSSVASELASSLNDTPRSQTLSLSLTRSPNVPTRLPLLPTTPRTPRDASLTPREQIDRMRERVKAREASEAEAVCKAQADARKRSEVSDFDDMLGMVSTLSKIFYQKSATSARLDVLVKEINKTSVRFSSAVEVERLIRKLADAVPLWITVAPSEFNKDASVIRLNNQTSFAAVQRALRDQQDNLRKLQATV